jgi:two-component system response regulator
MVRDSILLIEDNPNDEELVALALRDQKFLCDLVVARDGIEGLDYLFARRGPRPKTNVPRLVLLDLKLPKMDGLSVLEKLRQDDRTRYVPVVIWSSSGERTDLQKAYELGATSYVQKPVNFNEFSEAIHQIVTYWLRLNRSPSNV